MVNTMEATMQLFQEHKKTKYGYLYAESGLPIHIATEAVEYLREHMTSMEDFEEELRRQSNLQDCIDNMEI
jgi:hypothetical protein